MSYPAPSPQAHKQTTVDYASANLFTRLLQGCYQVVTPLLPQPFNSDRLSVIMCVTRVQLTLES